MLVLEEVGEGGLVLIVYLVMVLVDDWVIVGVLLFDLVMKLFLK